MSSSLLMVSNIRNMPSALRIDWRTRDASAAEVPMEVSAPPPKYEYVGRSNATNKALSSHLPHIATYEYISRQGNQAIAQIVLADCRE